MNRLNKLLLPSLLSAMMFSFYISSTAQIINEQPSVAPGYDPIAATLDSLVNVTYIQRLNSNSSSAKSAFQPFETPSYTSDVYSKRIAKIQTPIPLCYNNQVQDYINLYGMKKRALTERVMGLAGLYFPLYEQILDQQGLPLEFKYLSIVESALNPMAVSRVGATGLWQFMLGTGKLYNLKINSFIDERRDPEKATYAACQYFKDMYAIYNDWLLVIAAYNCGAGNVNRAIARSGGKKTFWEICPYLPKETRGYVPAFIAVTYLMNYSAEHNLNAVPPLLSFYEADTVMIDQKVSLKAVADAINTPVELLSYLNPIYKRGIIPDSDEPMALRLPVNKMNSYLANISNIYRPQDNVAYGSFVNEKSATLPTAYHKVRRGERLQTIANNYYCTIEDLKKWNKLKGSKVATGQRLIVSEPQKKKSDKLVEIKTVKKDPAIAASSHSAKSIAAKKIIWHTVQPGDTLWKIAERYEGVTVDQIKELNNLQSNELKIGTRLKVNVSG